MHFDDDIYRISEDEPLHNENLSNESKEIAPEFSNRYLHIKWMFVLNKAAFIT